MNVVLSTNDFKENEMIEDLLDGIEQPIEAVYGDGAYDAKNVYDACDKEGSRAVIPPRKGSKIKQHGNSRDEPYQREQNIREIRKKGERAGKRTVIITNVPYLKRLCTVSSVLLVNF